ncbi:MAG: UDP-N-acetylmuramoyl-tripeptide--D-alanyl-D-alanine ligase [Fibrobacterota bacterium]
MHKCEDHLKASPVTIDQLSEWLQGRQSLSAEILARPLPAIWMDSRKLKRGDIFLALKGNVRDGHDYISAALENGACAVICSREFAEKASAEIQSFLIAVNEPLQAVSRAAREYRRYLDIPVIAVTGSNGKTTTAKMLRSVLSAGFRVEGTVGNWNNHIGVPLSVLRLSSVADIAVFELGANHSGEIRELCSVVEPDMGVITNIGYAHVGYFGGIDATTRAKFELAQSVQEHGGVLYINGDDERSRAYCEKNGFDALSFGCREDVDIRAEDVSCSENGTYGFTYDGISFELPLAGLHFVYALLPALALAQRLGVSVEAVQKEIAQLRPVSLRGEIRSIQGMRWILDCYNSNPSSMEAALKMLRDIPVHGGRRVVISGDMGELAEYTENLHRQTGYAIACHGVDICIGVGRWAQALAEGAREGGLQEQQIHIFSDVDAVIAGLGELVHTGDLILLKGSRSVGLERVAGAAERGQL